MRGKTDTVRGLNEVNSAGVKPTHLFPICVTTLSGWFRIYKKNEFLLLGFKDVAIVMASSGYV